MEIEEWLGHRCGVFWCPCTLYGLVSNTEIIFVSAGFGFLENAKLHTVWSIWAQTMLWLLLQIDGIAYHRQASYHYHIVGALQWSRIGSKSGIRSGYFCVSTVTYIYIYIYIPKHCIHSKMVETCPLSLSLLDCFHWQVAHADVLGEGYGSTNDCNMAKLFRQWYTSKLCRR